MWVEHTSVSEGQHHDGVIGLCWPVLPHHVHQVGLDSHQRLPRALHSLRSGTPHHVNHYLTRVPTDLRVFLVQICSVHGELY